MSPFTRALAVVLALGLAGPALAEAPATAEAAVAETAGEAAPATESTTGSEAAPATGSTPGSEAAQATGSTTGSEAAQATEAATAGEAASDGEGAQSGAAAAPAEAAEDTPAEAAEDAPAEQPAAKRARPDHVVRLGPVGQDAEGNPGRVHTVASGDTLWDISDAYLGTPWVWPSIWSENQEVENPHVIHPGDTLWVSPTEIRRVSDAEAQAMLAAAPADGAADMGSVAYDALPADADQPKKPMFRYSMRDGLGLVSENQLDGAASIVSSPVPRKWFGTMDDVHIGLGEGEVEAGEQFVVFRARERVFDPSSGRLLGWNVRVLGWLEVSEPQGDVALASVRMSFAEMKIGDRLLPRELMPLEVEIKEAQPGIDGQVAFMPADRFTAGSEDVVFLDLGTEDGLEIGNVLEIYRPVGKRREAARSKDVDVPPTILGELIVVSAFPRSAAGVVRGASESISVGARVRAVELEEE